MVDEVLQKVFGFNEADLINNRSGVLTSNQRKRLEGAAQFTGKLFMIIGIIILGIAVLPSIILFFVKAQMVFLVIWSVVWIPIWSFTAIMVIRMGRPGKKDLNLKRVEGRVNIIKEHNYNSASKKWNDEYELHIGGVTFDVDSDLANIMMQGDAYAIYYLEGTKKILSAEKITSRN
jgi:hypothetical protein